MASGFNNKAKVFYQSLEDKLAGKNKESLENILSAFREAQLQAFL